MGVLRVAKIPMILHANIKDWSDCMGLRADLGLSLADMPSCTFRCTPAQKISLVRAAKAQRSLHISTVLSDTSLLSHIKKRHR